MAAASKKTANVKTRAETNVWLVGQQLAVLDMTSSSQLPTVGLTMRRLFYELKTNKLSLSESCSNVVDGVLYLWYLSHIPTTQKRNAVAKLKVLYEKHVSLGRNKSRRTDRQLELESEFCELMEKLFDVAHADCDKEKSAIEIPKDRVFLQDQRGPRKMFIDKEDLDFKEREEKRQRRRAEEVRRRETALKEVSEVSSVVDLSYEEDDEIDASSLKISGRYEKDPDDESVGKYHHYSTRKHPITVTPTSSATDSATKRRRLIDNPLFVASLDRTKTTTREAMHIVAPALKAAGVDLKTLSLSSSSIYRARKTVRRSTAQTQKELFVPTTPLIAHFDGKLLPDSDGRTEVLVDRMPIVVSGLNTEKLLAIPKLPVSTGELMGNAVVQTLQEWKAVPDWLAGLCFDTTSSNTGINTGAITVIQRAFDKRLLFLACRHHILEIISAAVFDQFFKSSGPQIALFGRFKEKWQLLDLAKYAAIDTPCSGVKSELTNSEKQWLDDKREEVVSFLVNLINQETQPRQDYLEFCKLSLLMLGGSSTHQSHDCHCGVHFSPPGAYHRARWMAKGIYCLKIYLFREQFKLNQHELQALRRICLFTITIYIKAWITAPSSCDAPNNDLSMLQCLESFADVDNQLANIAAKKMKGHLWYLSEDLIGLALFSEKVWDSEKSAMVHALKKQKMQHDLRRVDPKKITTFQTKTLSDFVTERSLNLFTAMRIDPTFLTADPSTWLECPDYISAKQKITSLRVINDCAERAVKLATDFNNVLTHDEIQRQLVFQIVEHHRKVMALPLKKNYMAD